MAITTALAMYEYANDHRYAFGFTKKMALKHFAIIEKNLEPDEFCELAFIGMNNYRGRRTQNDYTAFAVTNKRIFIAQKKRFTDYQVSIYWYHLNRVYHEDNPLLDVMILDSVSGVFHIGLRKDRCQEIIDQTKAIWESHDQRNQTQIQLKPQPEAAPKAAEEPAPVSNVDQILQYKELLDQGVLTEEEFAAVKKKILGI